MSWNSFSRSSFDKIPSLKNALNSSKERASSSTLFFKAKQNILSLKCYYDPKNTFIFSSDFETLFTKHSPCEILGLNFEKTVH